MLRGPLQAATFSPPVNARCSSRRVAPVARIARTIRPCGRARKLCRSREYRKHRNRRLRFLHGMKYVKYWGRQRPTIYLKEFRYRSFTTISFLFRSYASSYLLE